MDLRRDVNFKKIELKPSGEKLFLQKFEEVMCRYYLRIMALDHPGVLSKISGILGKHGISIASVIQKERHEGKAVPIVMLTHHAREKDMAEAVREIHQMSFVKKKPDLIRIQT
jgi:homoserine dehydrogenase